MKLKRFEIVEICNAIETIKGDFNKFFLYSLSKIQKTLQSEYELILETIKPSEDYLKYEYEKKQLIKTYCEKDLNGNVIETAGRVRVERGSEKMLKDSLSSLYVNNKDLVDKRNTEMKQIVEFMDSDIELDITKIPLKDFPDIINNTTITNLYPIIDDIK
jgi:hypothetical protein